MKFSNYNIPISDENKPVIEVSFKGKNLSDGISCRDPFIMLYDDRYYLYKRSQSEREIECLVSEDLENWSEPIIVYDPPENFHGIKDMFWAPECHFYKGYFYIFTSVYSNKFNHRTISVYRSKNPLGPFEDIADGCITPKNWDTIDGTLYIDEDNNPWMVFVHEWTCMPENNGAMAAARLSDDFTHLVSEPIQLFKARDLEGATCGVTDGPYLHKSNTGTLYMIWSNFVDSKYAVALARSSNGRIDGTWTQEKLLYAKGLKKDFITDGGHAMIFADKEDRLRFVLHTPNTPCDNEFEHVKIYYLTEKNGTLEIE